jgi:hypothetical protein
MATLGFLGLALSLVPSVVLQFGGNPTDPGFLTAGNSLRAELFAWVFFAVALLFVLRSAVARDSAPLVRVGVSMCAFGATLECASVGCSIRTLAVAVSPPSLYKAEFLFGTLGWLALAVGVLAIQGSWTERRPARDRTAMPAERAAWQRALLVITFALLCSAGGEALGFGSFAAWHLSSSSQAALLSAYGPQLLTWLAIAAAALIVVNAARRGPLPRSLATPASFAAAGGVALTVSSVALLVAGEVVYRFLKFGWATPLVRIQIATACIGMLVFAGACGVAAATRQDLAPRPRDVAPALPYWPQVASATS